MAGEKILVVDDDEALRGVVASFLGSRGYEVQLAGDGQEALRTVHQIALPDLVITDVSMPSVDGLELTRRLRTHHRTAHIPIIILSGRRKPDEVIAGYGQGADDYVPKPVQMPVLAAKVETLLRRARPGPGQGPGVGRGKVIVFLHGKGGVGATTLAVNVAIGLILSGSYPVALLDLNLEFGGVPVLLNLVPKVSLADLSGSIGQELDDSELRELILEHASNLWVVTGSLTPERASLITPGLVGQIIQGLRERAQYLLVDVSASFSEANLAAVDAADLVCLVSTPHVAALKGTLECIEVLGKLNVASSRLLVILNHTVPKGLQERHVAAFLQRLPDVEVAYSGQFDEAANSGRPLITAFPKDVGATSVRAAAAQIAAAAVHASSEPSAARAR